MLLVRRACSAVRCLRLRRRRAGRLQQRQRRRSFRVFCTARACVRPRCHRPRAGCAGRRRWPRRTAGIGPQLAPLAVGSVAVFAQEDVVYGLRLADGHRMWSRAGGEDIAGLWRWQNLAVELTQAGVTGLPSALLAGLDASTGRTRWTLPIPTGPWTRSLPPPTAAWPSAPGSACSRWWTCQPGGSAGPARAVLDGLASDRPWPRPATRCWFPWTAS